MQWSGSSTVGRLFPRLRHVFAGRAYRGQKLLDALADIGK
jgi:putative transposase